MCEIHTIQDNIFKNYTFNHPGIVLKFQHFLQRYGIFVLEIEKTRMYLF